MVRLKTIEEGQNPNTGLSTNVLGTFEGKSGDGEVTNENGLDISTPVWQTVFDSEEFKYGIEHGYYIGFLGHPEDPGCQDFEHACIILRDASINEKGEVYAKVDLIDTPVGRIVKTFIDAGVEFGLSVRGAGDIIENSVDPDTFCFRGFDLVVFPAYKDAIPKFTEIAASSKLDDVKKYKKVCSSVDRNLSGVNDLNSLEIIQSQFGSNSKEYKEIQNKIDVIRSSKSINNNMYRKKITSAVDMYMSVQRENEELKKLNNVLSSKLKDCKRKLNSSKRIYSDQCKNYNDTISELEMNVSDLKKTVLSSKKMYKDTNHKLSESENRCNKLEDSNRNLKDQVKANMDKYNDIVTSNKKLKENNLIYQRKITQYEDDLKDKDSVIASLKAKEHETVKASKDTEMKISNFDKKISELEGDVKCALSIIKDYQDAYASLYASAIGVSVNNLTVDNTTTVNELRKKLSACCAVSENEDSLDVEEISSSSDEYDMITV